jgi:hypothetical protein
MVVFGVNGLEPISRELVKSSGICVTLRSCS